MRKLWILFFLLTHILIINCKKLKLYTMYTSSHKTLYETWFLPSIKDNYEIISYFYDDIVGNGEFRADDWFKAIEYKIDLIIKAINENKKNEKDDKIFIFSDVDIQFFRSTEKIIREKMRSKDMVFQRDSPSGTICTGFFACRANAKTLKFWRRAKRLVKQKFPLQWHDQTAANFLIRQRYSLKINWDYLPVEFFSGGTLTGKRWNPGNMLPIPQAIILHHANWTIGIANKIEQLKYVSSVVNERRMKLHE